MFKKWWLCGLLLFLFISPAQAGPREILNDLYKRIVEFQERCLPPTPGETSGDQLFTNELRNLLSILSLSMPATNELDPSFLEALLRLRKLGESYLDGTLYEPKSPGHRARWGERFKFEKKGDHFNHDDCPDLFRTLLRLSAWRVLQRYDSSSSTLRQSLDLPQRLVPAAPLPLDRPAANLARSYLLPGVIGTSAAAGVSLFLILATPAGEYEMAAAAPLPLAGAERPRYAIQSQAPEVPPQLCQRLNADHPCNPAWEKSWQEEYLRRAAHYRQEQPAILLIDYLDLAEKWQQRKDKLTAEELREWLMLRDYLGQFFRANVKAPEALTLEALLRLLQGRTLRLLDCLFGHGEAACEELPDRYRPLNLFSDEALQKETPGLLPPLRAPVDLFADDLA